LIWKGVYFSAFLKVVIVDLNSLVATLIQLPKGVGKLIFGDTLHAPNPARGQSALTSFLEREKVR
jgi:hypothetical protein